ncbi:MAG: hypothetical protein HY216_13730, partial [Candidatus Rokubacteria bacterium]|nr:hypothetical protein [Candidatus Rokubacteria bacterium]
MSARTRSAIIAGDSRWRSRRSRSAPPISSRCFRAAPRARWWRARAGRQLAAVAIVLGGVYAALSFPLVWLGGWWLPRRFGLLHQPLSSWLRDRAKAAAIGGVLSLLALEVVYALLRATPWWWLLAATVFFAANVVITFVVPVWVIPLFYRLTPLADAALATRLLALARQVGVGVVGVWVADQSRKSRTANAAVVGLGRTRRILLFDTLLQRFAPE